MTWGEIRSIIKAALGIRRYILLSMVAGLAGIFAWLFAHLEKIGLPVPPGLPLPWAAAIAVIFVIVAWALLEYSVTLGRRISGARVELSRLRAKGVDIRNDGRFAFPDESSWLDWKQKAEDWNTEVIAAIGKVNEADAQWFSILDIVPEPRLPMKVEDPSKLYDGHMKLYREHDCRVARLGEMVRELWRE